MKYHTIEIGFQRNFQNNKYVSSTYQKKNKNKTMDGYAVRSVRTMEYYSALEREGNSDTCCNMDEL